MQESGPNASVHSHPGGKILYLPLSLALIGIIRISREPLMGLNLTLGCPRPSALSRKWLVRNFEKNNFVFQFFYQFFTI